jgi:hypothetical protein
LPRPDRLSFHLEGLAEEGFADPDPNSVEVQAIAG